MNKSINPRASLETIKGVEVLRVDRGAIDYVVHGGVLFSINGGYFMSPRTNDWRRWSVNPEFASDAPDRIAVEYYKSQGVDLLMPHLRMGKLACSDAALRDHVLGSLAAAQESGYDMSYEDAENIVADLKAYDSDLLRVEESDLLIIAREWQLLMKLGATPYGSTYQGCTSGGCAICGSDHKHHLGDKSYCPWFNEP